MHENTELTVREALKQASSLLMRVFADRERAAIAGEARAGAASCDQIRTGEVPAEAALAKHADEARSDAEILLMHVLGWDKTRLLLEGDAPFPARLADRWREALARRAAGEPVQYITGEQEFYGLTFEVGPAVLIPRPETELLVEAVVKRIRKLFGSEGGPPGRRPDRHAGAAGHPDRREVSSGCPNGREDSAGFPGERRVSQDEPDLQKIRVKGPQTSGLVTPGPLLADIGTGSGAIAVTLARLLPGWRVAACDLSPEALEIARRNAVRAGEAEDCTTGDSGGLTSRVTDRSGELIGRQTDGSGGRTGPEKPRSGGFVNCGKHGAGRLADRIRFLQGDLLEPLIAAGERVDVLVSNPPYIPSGELAHLQPEVRDHEPRLALDGGPDGLEAYRRMVRQIGRLPEPPRLVAFEVGFGQARIVAAMLAETGWWPGCEIVRDYAGIERHVLAWRP